MAARRFRIYATGYVYNENYQDAHGAGNIKKRIEITDMVESFQISGSVEQLHRVCSMETIWTNTTPTGNPSQWFVPDYSGISIMVGWVIEIIDTINNLNIPIFTGTVWTRTLTYGNKQSLNICDELYRFSKSQYSFNCKAKLKDIIKTLAKELGIPVGNLNLPDITHTKLYQSNSMDEILKDILVKAGRQTGITHTLYIDPATKQINAGPLGDRDSKVYSAPSEWEYSEDIEELVNRVRVFDEKNNFIKSQDGHPTSLKYYGIVEKDITKKKDEDANKLINAAMQDGPNVTANITVQGDPQVKAGVISRLNMHHISPSYRDLYIIEDTHRVNNLTKEYTMDLKFSWSNGYIFKDTNPYD